MDNKNVSTLLLELVLCKVIIKQKHSQLKLQTLHSPNLLTSHKSKLITKVDTKVAAWLRKFLHLANKRSLRMS